MKVRNKITGEIREIPDTGAQQPQGNSNIPELLKRAAALGIKEVPINGMKVPTQTPQEVNTQNIKFKQQEQSALMPLEIQATVQKEAAIRNRKLQELSKVVDFFNKKIEEIPGGSGIMGRAQGIGTKVQGWLQTDPKAAAYMADLQGMRALIARGLGDVGNLSETEQKAAINLLPDITDNLETRRQKIKNFNDLLTAKGLTFNTGISKGKPKNDPLGVF